MGKTKGKKKKRTKPLPVESKMNLLVAIIELMTALIGAISLILNLLREYGLL